MATAIIIDITPDDMDNHLQHMRLASLLARLNDKELLDFVLEIGGDATVEGVQAMTFSWAILNEAASLLGAQVRRIRQVTLEGSV